MMSSFSKQYDVCVIGSGLAGLTAANRLAKCGHSVLLLEQHTQLGGLAAYFKRPGGYTFDVSLHGFPVGMIKDKIVYILNNNFDIEDINQFLNDNSQQNQ